jgi:L,D-peptidoglycan transpeptidase YkuD (ErfK/YbiS/YcfS/YnhG family)
MVRGSILFACLVLCFAAAAVGGGASASRCAATLAGDLATATSSKQVVTVVVPMRTSSRGELRLWRRAGTCWIAAGGPWRTVVGRNGVSSRRREGDGTTPVGAFGFGRTMYGVAPDPGVRYRYRRLLCGDWWVEDSRSPYYNRFRHVRCGSKPPFRVTTGDLASSPTAYRHFAFIRYNVDPTVPGRGSGIFLHAATGKPTAGCVSLPLARLVTTLRWLRPTSHPVIVIGTRSDLRRL